MSEKLPIVELNVPDMGLVDLVLSGAYYLLVGFLTRVGRSKPHNRYS